MCDIIPNLTRNNFLTECVAVLYNLTIDIFLVNVLYR